MPDPRTVPFTSLLSVKMEGNISAISYINNSSGVVREKWNIGVGLQTVFSSLAFVTNGFVFVLFIRHRRLRTPFTMYLINLLLANLVVLLATPLCVFELMRTDWFAKTRWCRVLIYSDLISTGILLNSHLLITTNRVWAMVWPVSYRNSHTKTVAVAVCVGVWVYVHVMVVPFYVMDQVLYREGFNSDGWCVINVGQQLVYARILQVLVFLVPYIAILTAYPFLWYRRWAQARTAPHKKGPVPLEATPADKTPADQHSSATKKSHSDRSTGFTVLTVQTISIFLCWSISKVYGTVVTFMDIEIGWLGQLGAIMYLLQSVLDPVLFALALPDLRTAVVQAFKCFSR